MKTGLVVAIAACTWALTGACGTDSSNPGTGDPDAASPDSSIPDPPVRGFRIQSPEIVIPSGPPGNEMTTCFYFRTPNTEPMAITKWTSNMTPGSHHMIMYTTKDDVMPPGTVSPVRCGDISLAGLPLWTYATQIPREELQLPQDDGTGVPLAQEIPPNTAGFLQMHYVNSTDNPLTAQVTLDAVALDAGAAFTKTAAYVTYNGVIEVPPGATDDPEVFTCNTPPGAKFWLVSTHAHKQAWKTSVRSGSETVFESLDWEHPGSRRFTGPDFYTFPTNRLTYECRYRNTVLPNSTRTIRSGSSALTDEMCMATAYYFPATGPRFCYNNDDYAIPQ